MHRVFIAAVLLFATVGIAYADDVWSTAVAERPTNGWKIIHRFVDKLANPSERLAYPIAVTFSWKYDGPNGLPAKSETDSIYKLEDILDERVEKRGEGKLARVSTGNNVRTWTYYVKSEDNFRKTLREAASAVQLQLQVLSKADPGWSQLEEFKKGVRRP
jgi:hypothetical protein